MEKKKTALSVQLRRDGCREFSLILSRMCVGKFSFLLLTVYPLVALVAAAS